MITAVLEDTADDGSSFDAYMLKDVMGRTLPVRTIERLLFPGRDFLASERLLVFVPVPERLRRHVLIFFEHSAEIALIREIQVFGDLRQ